jgi:hypothetical protein
VPAHPVETGIDDQIANGVIIKRYADGGISKDPLGNLVPVYDVAAPVEYPAPNPLRSPIVCSMRMKRAGIVVEKIRKPGLELIPI